MQAKNPLRTTPPWWQGFYWTPKIHSGPYTHTNGRTLVLHYSGSREHILRDRTRARENKSNSKPSKAKKRKRDTRCIEEKSLGSANSATTRIRQMLLLYIHIWRRRDGGVLRWSSFPLSLSISSILCLMHFESTFCLFAPESQWLTKFLQLPPISFCTCIHTYSSCLYKSYASMIFYDRSIKFNIFLSSMPSNFFKRKRAPIQSEQLFQVD